jgi:hypothetical protein
MEWYSGKQSKCLYASSCTRTIVLYEFVKVRKLPTLGQVMTGTDPTGTSTHTFSIFFLFHTFQFYALGHLRTPSAQRWLSGAASNDLSRIFLA